MDTLKSAKQQRLEDKEAMRTGKMELREMVTPMLRASLTKQGGCGFPYCELGLLTFPSKMSSDPFRPYLWVCCYTIASPYLGYLIHLGHLLHRMGLLLHHCFPLPRLSDPLRPSSSQDGFVVTPLLPLT